MKMEVKIHQRDCHGFLFAEIDLRGNKQTFKIIVFILRAELSPFVKDDVFMRAHKKSQAKKEITILPLLKI